MDKETICKLLAGFAACAAYIGIYFYFGSLAVNGAPASIYATIACGAIGGALFGLAIALVNPDKMGSSDLKDCLSGLACLAAASFGGTAIAKLFCLGSIVASAHLHTAPITLVGTFWGHVGVSFLWFFVSMFCSGMIHNIDFRSPSPRRTTTTGGGDFKIRGWGRM